MRALLRHPWLVVGLLALIAFGLTVHLLRTYVRPVNVVVARTDLPAGTKLTADVLGLKEVPKSAVPAGAFTRIEDAVGLTLTTARARGDVITSYVAGEAAASGIPAQLRPNHVAMAVRVDRATGIAGMLRPGQTVTVVALVDLSQIQIPQAAFVAQAPVLPYAPPPVTAPAMGTPTPTPTPLPTPTLTLEFLCDTWGDAGWCRANGRIRATGTDPNGTSIEVSGTTGGPAPQPLNCTGVDTCTATASVAEGTGTAEAAATGPGGSVSQTLAWKYDPTAPTLTVNVPDVLSCVAAITGRVEDATSGVAGVSWSRDGGATWESITTNTSGDFTVSWDVRSLPEGAYVVHFRAQDVAGNTTEVSREVLVRHPNIGIGIRPKKGFFWDTFRIGVAPDCMKITRIVVVVENPDGPNAVLGNWDTRAWDGYTVEVKWNGMFPDGAARPGAYWMRVDVWDTGGRVLRDWAQVVMPAPPTATPTLTPTSTPTPTATSTPTPTPTATMPSPATPGSESTPASGPLEPVRPTPLPAVPPAPSPQGDDGPGLWLWMLPALLFALFGLWDPRPKGLREVERLLYNTGR